MRWRRLKKSGTCYYGRHKPWPHSKNKQHHHDHSYIERWASLISALLMKLITAFNFLKFKVDETNVYDIEKLTDRSTYPATWLVDTVDNKFLERYTCKLHILQIFTLLEQHLTSYTKSLLTNMNTQHSLEWGKYIRAVLSHLCL